MSYNAETSRTFRINGTFSIAGSNAAYVQDVNITMDATSFQRSFINAGKSVFTQRGDIVGQFSFRLKNTTDLYAAANSSDKKTVTNWMEAINKFDPQIVDFIQTFSDNTPTTKKQTRITFKGRVMRCGPRMSADDAVEDMVVEGEITTFTSAIPVSS